MRMPAMQKMINFSQIVVDYKIFTPFLIQNGSHFIVAWNMLDYMPLQDPHEFSRDFLFLFFF